MSPALVDTLQAVAKAAAVTRDRWWIIGSAAVVLHGGKADPHDVDLLLSARDARRLCQLLGIAPIENAPSDLFQSALFARWDGPPLPVELMAGLKLHTQTGWSAVRPRTRLPVAIGQATLFVPDRTELIAILRSFGRPKDLARADLLAG